MNASLEQLQSAIARVKTEVGRVIIGQDEVIRQSLVVILTRNHGLIEGVPGVAKTLLTRTFAQTMGCPFARIQFTPDLMPADITGTNVFSLQRNEFTLIPGPVFTTFLLADEINRAPAKTQSALLQAMQERAVTIDRQTYTLSPSFTVFATMNPVESEGTYPLPEAQKDRFMMKIVMDPPGREHELELATRMLSGNAPETVLLRGEVQPVLQEADLEAMRGCLELVSLRTELMQYLVDVIRMTRSHESILAGGGPRATQALLLASRAVAAIDERDFVTPDDVRSMARPVLEHRLILRPESEIEGVTAGEVIQEILQKVPVPR
jgi:MoxR-like ATPase